MIRYGINDSWDVLKALLRDNISVREEKITRGRAVVRDAPKHDVIASCFVAWGSIRRSDKVRVIRAGIVVYPPADRIALLESLR